MKEQLDLTDGNGNGTTALMMAAKFGTRGVVSRAVSTRDAIT